MVTVIIPTCKGEDRVPEAVKSVLDQTYKDLEVIVVDDNGRGTECQIATERNLAPYFKDSRFKYIVHEVNKNGAAARNTGIRNASGEYIGFLDDDDIYLPGKIEKQVALFRLLDDTYGLVYGSFREVIDERRSRIVKAKHSDNFLFDFLCDRIIACSSTVLIRREVLSAAGEWDESFYRHQDLEFFARAASNYKTAFVEDICAEKRKLDRNTVKGEVYERYHMHYIKKMEPIVSGFSPAQKRKFYDHHCFLIGKAYIKDGNIPGALHWAKQSSNPCAVMIRYFTAAGVFLIRKVIR